MAEIRPHSNPKYREYGVLTTKIGKGRWRADLSHISQSSARNETLASFEADSEKEARRLAEQAAERR